MSSTVLGKRSRNVECTGSSIVRNTRSKRRAFVIENNENENPFVSHLSTTDDGFDDLDELPVDHKSSREKRRRVVETTPTKHGVAETHIVFSPSQSKGKSRATILNTTSSTALSKQSSQPQTPRHRDTASRRIPITPRHRVGVVGKPLTPHTPRTPSTPRSLIPTIYNEARQTFTRSSNRGKLFGREKEREELTSFISTRVQKAKNGCIYISGPPGTGKSAFVDEICQGYGDIKDETVYTYVNCMSVKSADDIYTILLEKFGENVRIDLVGTDVEILKRAVFEREVTYLVTLDEIDHLLDVDLELLYNLFQWSLSPKSSLVLIGIANALDFTDRFLPRLKSRGLKPHLLPFLPYSATQIASVITGKLKALVQEGEMAAADYVPFIHPTAIQFLSKKVAAQSGDLRKALDICRRAIDLIEAETKDQHVRKACELTPTSSPSKIPLVENMNLSSPQTPRSPSKAARQTATAATLSHLTAETAPRATIAHMARITSVIFSNGTTQRLKALNLQQKAVLCALSALETKNRASSLNIITNTPSKPCITTTSAPTVRTLFEVYTVLCKRENVLHPLTSTEFRDILSSLEALSLISSAEGKQGSFTPATTPSRKGRGGGFGTHVIEEKQVASCIGRKELTATIEGAGSSILRGILDGEGVA
ncbi:cell division control protein Cdc6 [Patellaria atrata CBS 101060]|uniref:Cell division control protein n=1 Tax=Patellaria atrata CBS 101060 TaxID=1346257 RepID=A0A9P4VUN3_9PEZI|nr:cell division control protein Cdc6 [Patellaria atrata CBS 101060]